MASILRTIQLSGFDSGGEPSLREMSNGTLEISFQFMPPSDVQLNGGSELGTYERFDQEMSQAAGVPVVWEDREFFWIDQPPPGTLERVQAFIEAYRQRER